MGLGGRSSEVGRKNWKWKPQCSRGSSAAKLLPTFSLPGAHGQEVQHLVISLPASDWAHMTQVGKGVAAWNLGLSEDSAQQGKSTTQAAPFAMSWGYGDLDEPMTRSLSSGEDEPFTSGGVVPGRGTDNPATTIIRLVTTSTITYSTTYLGLSHAYYLI